MAGKKYDLGKRRRDEVEIACACLGSWAAIQQKRRVLCAVCRDEDQAGSLIYEGIKASGLAVKARPGERGV